MIALQLITIAMVFLVICQGTRTNRALKTATRWIMEIWDAPPESGS